MSALQVTWFLLVGLLLTVYAVLDGFDLGVGFWHLFTKKDQDRRVLLNSIGPVWDGNEVWLLTGAGAIFAAFPPVYATVFSGFYLALMLVLLALIFRAVSVEFRSKVESARWRSTWDMVFGIGSSLTALLLGVALGNILGGLPLDSNGNFSGSFFSLLNPYALLIGLVGLAMLATHGALYLQLKTSDDLCVRALSWAKKAWVAYLALFIVAVVTTIVTQADLLENYKAVPFLWILPVLALALVISIGVFAVKGRAGWAFISSSLSIVSLMGLTGAALFPRLVPAIGMPERSLTLFNSSSSELTLKSMLILASIGMPFVIGYTIWMYRAFAGKVKPDQDYGIGKSSDQV
ncbi:MAG TPA: cytochrome d ubiquinol oxidase subunit II [Myxococcota bacterium]|nr:cytochrome d ubiquinol oxidase subunit II [Myxococcota bacterium]